ncbi:MAG: dipicolinate synthase subunit B [Oscillospiraceae bacterium]|nr:dipicolinate synthase subunit B [Oscillospiraceae bacterium]
MKRTVGFAMTGSFCTYRKTIDALHALAAEYNVIPIFSEAGYTIDSRFGTAESFRNEVETICGANALHSITEVEPFGPKKLLDLLVVAPCTGNTLGKLANGIADSPVTFACKAHLRNGRPIVLAVSTNDGLSASAENIGRLLNRKHYYFVPFGQDSPNGKPYSLVADMDLLSETVAAALRGEQLQPLLLK